MAEETNQQGDTQDTKQQATGTTETKSTSDKATGGKGGDATLTQEALNKRLSQAKRAGQRELLELLGVDSVEVLQSKLNTKPDEALTKQLADLTGVVEDLKRKGAEAEQRAQVAENQRRADATKTALTQTIKAMRLKDEVAEDILNWAAGSGRDLAKLLDDKLQPNAEAITELVNAAREARPSWFKTASPAIPSNAGGLPSDADKQRRQQIAKNQEARLRNS